MKEERAAAEPMKSLKKGRAPTGRETVKRAKSPRTTTFSKLMTPEIDGESDIKPHKRSIINQNKIRVYLYKKTRIDVKTFFKKEIKMIEAFMQELKLKGYTQKQIAEMTKITQQSISDLFRGSEPGAKTLVKLADAFNVTTDHILGRNKQLSKKAA